MFVGQHLQRLRLVKLILVLSLLPHAVFAANEILGFRLSENNEHTRIVFDLSGPVEHSLFTLRDPERVVIDIADVQLSAELPQQVPEAEVLRRIRNAPREGRNLRVVLDLKDRVRPQSFMLRPDDNAGYRLVIDLFGDGPKVVRQVTKTVPSPDNLRDVIIAVDAGHGGKDPGAVGNRGTYEKHVALAIARELAGQINKVRGMKAVLIRDGDYYIGLRERMIKAREHKADLFISIHADAYKDKHANGSSVYALSLSGASSEAAQWLANRENSAELIGGVTLDDKDDLVASVLLDLSQNATIQSSLDIGSQILSALGKQGDLHKGNVQQAGFIVLKSPDIPSVLVETAFISNPVEERKLVNKQHQSRIAKSILDGVHSYFERKAPPGTLLAELNRKLRSTEKLSANW
ncbi:MAG: N-acetylmuramoyl-L-alanine amidase [Gammaproteobacteria bacterium]|nr:N-acetylmuramoyl-L-alanine amidase [Gammaproteobacteria bacterium]